MNVETFWSAVLCQDAAALESYFAPDAYVNWHCTNEHFTAAEYIRANCEYPGRWDGKVERAERLGDLLITVTHVYSLDQPLSFHVSSFIQLKDEMIVSMDEYWGDDGPAPQWRLEKRLGVPIRPQTA